MTGTGGVVSAVIGFIAFLASGAAVIALRHWIAERIRAGADEAVARRLATLQFDLDKELERHRSELQASAEVLRAALAKSTTDFAIYAQRKHDAVVGLCAGMVESVNIIHEAVHRVGQPLSDAERLPHVVRARNTAGRCYYRHALYLTAELDSAAHNVLGRIDHLAGDFLMNQVDPLRTLEQVELLLSDMEQLQAVARAELSRSRDTHVLERLQQPSAEPRPQGTP